MQFKNQQKIVFVINPKSGGIQKDDHRSSIENYFKDKPVLIQYFTLTGKNDSATLRAFIELENPDTIAVVGGDGTVSMIAKLIMGSPMCMAIIPAGSANGMAKELGIDQNIMAAISIIENGICKKADVIEINNTICLHLSDIGLNAQMIKYFEQGDSRGKYGYAKVALKALWRRHSIRVTIRYHGHTIIRSAFMVVLANASKYGTGAVINPKGDLYDGLFEVIIIRKISLLEIFKMWFRPRPFDPEKTEILQAESVEINTTRKVHFQIDGEYLGKTKYVKAKILPAQLHILVPK